MKCRKRVFFLLLFLEIFILSSLHAELVGVLKEGSDKWGYDARFHTATVPWDGSEFTALLRLQLPLNEKGEALLPRESWTGIYILDSKNHHRYIPALVSRDFSSATERLFPLLIAYEKKGHIQWRGEKKTISPGKGLFELEVTFSQGNLHYRVRPIGGIWTDAGHWKTPANFQPDTIGISLDAYHKKSVPGEIRFLGLQITGKQKKLFFDFTKEIENNSALKWNSWNGEWMPSVHLQLKWLPNEATHYVFDHGTVPDIRLRIETTRLLGKNVEASWNLLDESGISLAKGTRKIFLSERSTNVTFSLPPLNVNGIYRFDISVKDSSGHFRRSRMQFAVIPKQLESAGKAEPDSPYIISNTRNYALFSRIGFRKLRGCFFGYDAVGKTIDELKPYGMLYVGTMNGRAGGKSLKNLAENTKFQIQEILNLKRKKPADFLFSEFYNEPENWSPTGLHTQLWPFAVQVAEIFHGVHAAGTNLKMINPGVTHRNLSFLYQLSCAAMGNPSRMPDIVAVHGYRSPQMPEFAHKDDIEAIRALFGNRPVWNNEDAYFVEGTEGGAEATITAPSASAIELPEMTQAAYLVRGMLNQLAAGYSAVAHFDGIRNHSMFRDFWHVRPSAVAFAALTRVLPNPHFLARETKATDNLWVLKWKSDSNTVYSFWTLKNPEKITLSGDVEILDGFGNRLKGNSFICGELPHYVRTKAALHFVRDRKNGWKPSHPLESEVPPLYGGVAISSFGGTTAEGIPEIRVHLYNPGKNTVSGTISPVFMNHAPKEWKFYPDTLSYQLNGGESKLLRFRPSGKNFTPDDPDENAGYTSLWWCEGYRIALQQKIGTQQNFLPQRRLFSLRGIPHLSGYQIDGNSNEWKNVPVFRTRGTKKRNLALASFWGGVEDFDANFQLAWCREGLLLFAKVTDDRHDAEETGLHAWRTDSIQLGITGKYENPDLTDYPVLTLATSGAVLQRDIIGRKAGIIPEVKLATKRIEPSYQEPGQTLYECLIPWDLIPGIKAAEAGTTLGFQIIFNESDGFWRKGWVGWFSPMGGHIVDSRTFGDITLTRVEASFSP